MSKSNASRQLSLDIQLESPAKTADGYDLDRLPDVRDGLTREQRVILYVLYQAQQERRGRNVPTLMLYGRVCEHIPMRKDRFMALLSNLVGRGAPPR